MQPSTANDEKERNATIHKTVNALEYSENVNNDKNISIFFFSFC